MDPLQHMSANRSNRTKSANQQHEETIQFVQSHPHLYHGGEGDSYGDASSSSSSSSTTSSSNPNHAQPGRTSPTTATLEVMLHQKRLIDGSLRSVAEQSRPFKSLVTSPDKSLFSSHTAATSESTPTTVHHHDEDHDDEEHKQPEPHTLESLVLRGEQLLAQDSGEFELDSRALVVSSPKRGTTHSHLNFGLHGQSSLQDRDKELAVLRQEYRQMMERAQQSDAETQQSQSQQQADDHDPSNTTPVICIAGKAGTGKTALVQAWMKQEMTSTNQSAGQFFICGKFAWPTNSITSSLPAHPGGGGRSSFSNQPALSQESQAQHEPYQAFDMALGHLLHQIQSRGPEYADQVRQRLRTRLGPSSIKVLQELSAVWGTFLQKPKEDENDDDDSDDEHRAEQPPAFAMAATTTTTSHSNTNNNNTNTKSGDDVKSVRVDNRVPRLKYVLRQLFRAVCDNRQSCVLILDDAQWADQESLELAHSLHTDFENPFFLLVLTWRTNDIHEEESCYTALGSNIGVFANRLVQSLDLDNISLEAVTLVVAEALQMPTTDVTSLSKLVFHQTNGNPFYLRHFLEYLEREHLLKWNLSERTWEWDETKISELKLRHNVLQLVVAKLRCLPRANLIVIQILACLGQSFEEDSACVVIDKMDTMELFNLDISHSDALGYVNALVRDGLLVRHGSSSNSANSLRTTFAHDQIQETAFQIIHKDSRSLLQLRIGERLLEIMEERGAKYISFRGVDLCSKGIGFLSTKERMGLALYNLMAGEKCMKRASFATALAYFEFGLSSLRIHDWLKGRLSLELSFGAMEAAFCVDDFEKVRLHYDRIASSGSTSDDKIRAHVLLIRATGTRGDAKEAIATGYRVLKSMGIKTIMESSNKMSMFVHLTKTKMALRKHSQETLSNLCELSGTNLRQAMCIIEAMLPFAYVHDRQLFLLLVMKAVRWSVKYGVSAQSAMVFATLGSFPAFQAMDMNMALALGQASLSLLERFGSSEYPGLVLAMVHSQILNWNLDPMVVQQNLQETYRVSMEHGDNLPALCSLAASFAVSYDAGQTPLGELERLGETFSLRMKESKCETIASIHNVTWQTVLNLRNDKTLQSELTGRAMEQERALLQALAFRNDLLEFAILSRQLQLCFFAGEHKKADELRQKCETVSKSVAWSPHLVAHVSYAALNCVALCPSHSPGARKSSHYKMGHKLLKKLVRWQNEHGYRFSAHTVHLIQAEFDRVDGRGSSAAQHYQSAAWNAQRLNNLRDQGLAHERAGRYFMHGGDHGNDEVGAAEHFDQAVQAYHAWGATALVQRLLDDYGHVMAQDPRCSELSCELMAAQSRESNLV